MYNTIREYDVITYYVIYYCDHMQVVLTISLVVDKTYLKHNRVLV